MVNTSLTARSATEKQQLDGRIAFGKKVAGAITYEVPAHWEELEISFTPDFWAGKDTTLVANNSYI